MSRCATTFIMAMLLCACGSAAPPLVVQAPKAQIEVAPAPAVPQARAKLEPVEAPGDLIMHLRWLRPAETLEAVERLLGPNATPADDVVSLMFEQLEGAEGVDHERLRDAIALDVPADVIAVSVDPEGLPLVVASVGLRSIKAGLAAFEGEVRRGDGTWLAYGPETLGREPPPETPADVDPFDVDAEDAEPDVPPTCIIAPALGPSSARIVCSAEGDAAKQLATFAARNVAAMPSTADDFRIDFSLGRWTKQLAQEVDEGWPAFRDEALTEQEVGDAKLAAVLRRVGDDMVRASSGMLAELDRVTVAASVGDRGLDLALELGMNGRRSFLSRMLADAAAHDGPPPAMMTRLPSDFSSAQFGRTGARNIVTPWLKAVRDVLAAVLDADKVGSPSDRMAWLALLRANAADHTPYVSATGAFKPAAAGSPSGRNWWLFGIEQPSGPSVDWFRDAVRAYNRPAVRQLVHDMLDAAAANNLPRVTMVPVAPPFVARIVVDLPKALTSPSAGGAPSAGGVPSRYELLVLADGDRTWTGVSSDGAALRQLMLKLPASSTGAPGTAANQRIRAVLAGRDVTRVSVTSVGGIVQEMDPFLTILTQALGAAGPPWWTPGALPHGGVDPILSVVDASGGDHPSVRMSLEIPRTALEDFGFLSKQVGQALSSVFGGGLSAPVPPLPGAPP